MLVIAGLIIAFVLIAIFSNRKTRACRWREYPKAGDSVWTCVNCGVTTRAPAGKAPRTCLRDGGPT
ncbi:hypothetical protein [Citreimonas salinaria]|uniref:hypothetical protein n=1 Tax=Citreimonas salinaria TaxID=321339 RepID=UPI000B7C5BC8|nr:hypothetical protein [Citreimonas salinaria]